MRKQQGFTLIELVVVIIILGILAVTAAPRFINVQEEAQESALQGLAGTLKASADLIYAQAAVDGIVSTADAATTSVATADGTTVLTDYGYPTPAVGGIVAAFNGDSAAFAASTAATTDWVYSVSGTSVIFAPGSKITSSTSAMPSACIVTYSLTTDDTKKSSKYTVAVDNGC